MFVERSIVFDNCIAGFDELVCFNISLTFFALWHAAPNVADQNQVVMVIDCEATPLMYNNKICTRRKTHS